MGTIFRKFRPWAGRILTVCFVFLAFPAGGFAEDCYGWDTTTACEAQASTLGSCLGCCQMVYDCRVFSGRCGIYCREIALTEFDACQGDCMAAFG